MSYKEKPQLKLYKYENSAFVLQAIIDDYQECSFEDNLFEAGQFSITINYNIPNSQLLERGLFIQFGNSWKFGEITRIQDQIGEDGKGSQYRIITGFDARYILKRRVIKNMNSNGLWIMTGKGEIVLRNLINDQAGTNAEEKRRLPIINTIPDSGNAIGKEYSASEQFSNLYEICKTIAIQSEIGWRLEFDGTNLNLVCFEGTDRTQTVQFSTSFDSLANGEFVDSSESFSNAIYVGGKGQNDDRDIYEGESAIEGNSPSGLDRYESWDNQSSMTTQSEYETEALSMLNQYGQTLTMSGNGLAKCPYEYGKEYFVGDKIKIAFSGKSANAQILSVTEHWIWGNYEINFNFGKPLPDLNTQLQLILKQIQKASNKTNSKDSVRWYDIPTDTAMPASDVTYSHIGFIGNVGEGATFTLYRDSSGTGSKTYHVYIKQLGGSGKLTLTTGVSGATTLLLNPGTYVAIIYVDENGNITSQGMTATGLIQTGNNQPVESGAVADEISNLTEIASSLPTDAVLHYSFDEVPEYPDGTAVYFKNKNWTFVDWTCRQCTGSIVDSKLNLKSNGNVSYFQISGSPLSISNIAEKIVIVKFKVTGTLQRISLQDDGGSYSYQIFSSIKEISQNEYIAVTVASASPQYNQLLEFKFENASADNVALIEAIYIGNGSYSTPIIDNANGQWNSTFQSGVAVQGVSGKAIRFLGNNYVQGNLPWTPYDKGTFTVSCWVKNWNKENGWCDIISNWSNYMVTPLWLSFNNTTDAVRAIRFDVPNKDGGKILRYCVNPTDLIWNDFNTDLMHIVAVFNASNSALYINGKKINLTFETAFNLGSGADRKFFYIGRHAHEGNVFVYTKATFDDFLIFDRALSETEVLALYQNKANTPKYYDLSDYKIPSKQNSELSTPITIAGQSYTTVESALQALAGLV